MWINLNQILWYWNSSILFTWYSKELIALYLNYKTGLINITELDQFKSKWIRHKYESNEITYYGSENNYIYRVLKINNNVLHWIKSNKTGSISKLNQIETESNQIKWNSNRNKYNRIKLILIELHHIQTKMKLNQTDTAFALIGLLYNRI